MLRNGHKRLGFGLNLHYLLSDRMLGRIFGTKRDEVTGGWSRLHKEELYALYSSPNIIRVIKSRRLRWAGNVARMGRGDMHTGFWYGNLREGDHLEEADVDWRVILKRIFKKWDMSIIYTYITCS